ncbi:PAS domain-containing protein [Hymenobacter latericus]|uniref:PAS domain-containing protein n=1 Tax=Hymenobacter sp. YIM 151858-1 TaxID=2987688 RepID=UPI002225CB94|nr:PAS domain-containing protein [Hymenobacter sp. YIM 151858-1]UYZ59494.1 PAS domain-containing protein [Hymenobacter sp. YIM 151858-1]
MAAALPTSVDYQQLFHALPDALLLMTPNGTILDNTDAHVAASLKPREEVINRNLFEAYPVVDRNQGDEIERSHEHVRQHLQPHTMPVIRYDLAVPAEKGGGFEEMYWQATHYPILDAEGKLQYILQRTQNITEQYLAAQRAEEMQKALTEAQEYAHFVLGAVPVLVSSSRPDGRADYFNQRWMQFTGLTHEQLVAGEWVGAIHPDDQQRLADDWERVRYSTEEYQHEYRLRRHDGEYRWMLMRTVPRLDAAGNIVLRVGGSIDITDQKQMVEELLRANEEQAVLSDQAYQSYQLMRTQRETFHNLFMQAPALICILRGPEHRYDFVNPKYQQLFPHRQLLGRTVAEALPEVVEQGFVALLDNVYKTGETYIGNEVQIMLDRDGSGQLTMSYLNFTYQLYHEADAKAGISVFAFDVTDLVKARKVLEGNSTNPA